MKTQTKHVGQLALKRMAVVAAAAATLCLVPSAWGLSLGRLTVQSALGEALKAEIDVTSLSADEAANLRVRVASADAYRIAGIDYNPVLPQTKVVLQRRADGSPYLSISADRPVQEPFVDVILEMSWASGRLLREYTLLFDPPATAAARTPATSATPPVVAAVTPAPAPTPAPAVAAPAPVAPAPAQAAPRRAESPAPQRAAKAASAEGTEYRVKSGDTLSSIASRMQPQGVSLDQMLAGLYRGNAQAFVGNNMNRLRAGVVLNVPSGEQLAAVDAGEARQLIQAQSADFNAYRRRLAGAVPEQRSEPAAPRVSAGKVQAEVEDRKQAQTPTPDRLRLDKGKSSAVGGAASAEDVIAKERAAKESSARASEIQRNMEALKKLQAASAPAPVGRAAASAATTLPAVKPAPVAAVASAPALAASPVAVAASVATPAPVVSAASAEAPAASMATAASAPEVMASAVAAAPAASQPASAVAPAMADAEEPSILESLSSNPLVLPGAGLVLALLAGLGYYRLRGKKQEEAGVTSFLESRLQPDSFFGASGGQRVDTRDASGAPSSMSYSLSQIDAIGDVDPVAEADVYLAYGRDLQAEEILKEAMRANPERLAIRSKLLEVYAKRRDIKGFELLAGELYGLTGGHGDEWSHAQELGRSIDPENPLYEPGGQPSGPLSESGAGEMLGATTMPQSIVPSPSRFEHSMPDLDLNDEMPSSGSSADVDLDVSVPAAFDNSASLSGTSAFSSAPLGFDESSVSARGGLASNTSSMDFELKDLPDISGAATAPAPEITGFGIDLGGISLDLDAPSASAPAGVTGNSLLDQAGDMDDGTDPLVRKLELAEEFHQIGDFEGARDLLQDVVQKADGPLKARAQALLDKFS